MQTESSISTLSGKFFNILRPEEYDFEVDEIAEALSNICRYTGHVNTFYSVAEHSVLVSHLVPERLALTALFHDAAEAFLGDVSSPLKRLLPEYRKIEENVQKAIANHFTLVFPFPVEIHEADKRMYWNERRFIAPGPRDKIWHQELRSARKVSAEGLRPTDAKRMFLRRFKGIVRDGQRDSIIRLKAAA